MEIKHLDEQSAGAIAEVLCSQPIFAHCDKTDVLWLASRGLSLASQEDSVELSEVQEQVYPFLRDICKRNNIEWAIVPFVLCEGMFVFYENNPRNSKPLNLFEIGAPYVGIERISQEHGYQASYNVRLQPHSFGVVFDPFDVQELAFSNPEVWYTIITDKCRLSEAFSLSTQVFLSPTTKLKIAKYLYFHASRRQKKGYEPIIDNITQEMLATSFGVSRTTVSEAFMELKRFGAIEPSYRKIIVNPKECKAAIDEFSRDILDR